MTKDSKKAGEKAMHSRKKGTVKSGSSQKSASKEQAKVKAQSEAIKESAIVPERMTGLVSDDVTINEG